MEVVVIIRRWDLFVANFCSSLRRPTLWVMCGIPGILIAIQGSPGLVASRGLPLALTSMLITLLVLTIGLFVASILLSSLFISLRPGQLPGVLGQHLIRISPEGLFEETSVNSGTLAWAGITSVHYSRLGVLVQVTSSAFFLPRRSFGDAAQAKSFVALAQQLKEAATVARGG